MSKMNAEFAQLSVAAKAKGKQEEEEQGKIDLLTRVTNAAVELGKDSEDPKKAATYQLFYDLAVLEKRREEKRKNPVKVKTLSDLLEWLSKSTKDSDGDDIHFCFDVSDESEFEMPSEDEDDYDDGVDDEDDDDDDDDWDEERAKEHEKWILAKIESLKKAQEEFDRKWEELEPFYN